MTSPVIRTMVAKFQTPDDEKSLVAAAQQDPLEFARLYDHYVQPIYRYLYSRVGNSEEAKDLTSQTFLAALEALPRYRERGHFSAWLFSLARRKAMDYFRRNRPQVPLDDAVGTAATGMDTAGQVLENDELQRLTRLVRSLAESDQELIRLRYVADLSFSEMAALLGKSEAAVKKALYRLLARLQSQME